jgi:A/G-specific adenine glycosylase
MKKERTAATPGCGSEDRDMVAAQREHADGPAQAAGNASKRKALLADLVAWYHASRRDVAWRRTRDPYAIWLSEVMLQQTRVETVVPFYSRFLRAFPTVSALAEAPLDDVLALWSGLGYYRRARMLHAGARHVEDALGGQLPDTVEGLRTIPGIGPYTAGAIASIAFGKPAALVDGNVVRVLARLFAIDEDLRGGAGLARVWRIAEGLVSELRPGEDPGAWNQALMELGATVCTPREPRCLLCPAQAVCAARAAGLERALPRLSPKSKPRDEARVAVVATSRGRVLMARRRADTRFGGMWEPPSAVGEDVGALSPWCGRLEHVEERGVVRHVLSHRRLLVQVWSARALRTPVSCPAGDYERLELVRPDDLGARGVTTLAKKILRCAGVGVR